MKRNKFDDRVTTAPKPTLCQLGSILDSLKVHKEIVEFLLMLARKAIMSGSG